MMGGTTNNAGLAEALKELADHLDLAEGVYADEAAICRLAASALSPAPAPDELEVDDFVRKLRDFEQAYSTEFFAPLTEAEKDEMGGFLLSRVSAEMGRHLAKFLTQAAAALEQAHSTIAALRAERDEADNALVDKYRDPKTGSFKFPGDVAAIVRRLETAEAEVKRLTKDNEALRVEVARCHARLEIDHVFVAEGDDFVRREVPMNERLSLPDAVECRDATISILEADARKAMEGGE